ncbi:MarR family winged helix-turn-helix transcriptional regulator [Microbacterium sp. ZW T5_56]|uniref:MarR family winged helix-turn-helix transcriptional regulator n=1 Tax=Microbacterium sp. ZW T5_56 TaxID=3378081 RepID=UPI003854278B
MVTEPGGSLHDFAASPPRGRPPGATDRADGGGLYDIETSDPRQTLVDRSGVSAEDIQQITELMKALGALREAEQHLSEVSRRYMQLNETDMRALHYLIVCSNTNTFVTPGAIAHHLRISSASTTKLLDRLERGGHIVRSPHPTDRRALTISITPETHRAAMETVGRQQSKRFYSAARLTPSEREVVIRFLRDMTEEITLRDEAWAQEGAHAD